MKQIQSTIAALGILIIGLIVVGYGIYTIVVSTQVNNELESEKYLDTFRDRKIIDHSNSPHRPQIPSIVNINMIANEPLIAEKSSINLEVFVCHKLDEKYFPTISFTKKERLDHYTREHYSYGLDAEQRMKELFSQTDPPIFTIYPQDQREWEIYSSLKYTPNKDSECNDSSEKAFSDTSDVTFLEPGDYYYVIAGIRKNTDIIKIYSSERPAFTILNLQEALQVMTNEALLRDISAQERSNLLIEGLTWIATGAIPLGMAMAIIDRFIWTRK